MSIYGAPFVGSIKQVEDQWIDYNGHMNVAYYVLAFDNATDAFLDYIGLDHAYKEKAKVTMVTRFISRDMHLREFMLAHFLKEGFQKSRYKTSEENLQKAADFLLILIHG